MLFIRYKYLKFFITLNLNNIKYLLVIVLDSIEDNKEFNLISINKNFAKYK
jgi:hypothetical protein